MAIEKCMDASVFFSPAFHTQKPRSQVVNADVAMTALAGQDQHLPPFFAKITNVEVNVQVIMPIYVYGHTYNRRVLDMSKLLSFDLHDVPVMLGSASFVGSVAGVFWSIAFSSPAPSSLIIVAATAGLACGRMISLKSKAHR